MFLNPEIQSMNITLQIMRRNVNHFLAPALFISGHCFLDADPAVIGLRMLWKPANAQYHNKRWEWKDLRGDKVN